MCCINCICIFMYKYTVIPTITCMSKMEFMSLSTAYFLLWTFGSVRRDWRNSRRWAHMKSSRPKPCVCWSWIIQRDQWWMCFLTWTHFPLDFGSESSMLTQDFYQQHPAVQAMSDEEAESWRPESCSSWRITGWMFLSVWTWAIKSSKAWIFTGFIAYRLTVNNPLG